MKLIGGDKKKSVGRNEWMIQREREREREREGERARARARERKGEMEF